MTLPAPDPFTLELALRAGAIGVFLLAPVAAWRAMPDPTRRDPATGAALGVGLLLMTAALAARWVRLGHGPFFTLAEILASSLASLAAVYAVAWWRSPLARGAAGIVLGVLALLAAWLLAVPTPDSHFAPTYANPMLWLHVGFGKAFLGCALVASGLAAVVLLRALPAGRRWFALLPRDGRLDGAIGRALLLALLFETPMLVAGAVWAQDAWGRWWDWDPLETWAFATWLAVAFVLHLRLRERVDRRLGAWLVVGVFALAFVTFFGVPFVSTAAHKGAV